MPEPEPELDNMLSIITEPITTKSGHFSRMPSENGKIGYPIVGGYETASSAQ